MNFPTPLVHKLSTNRRETLDSGLKSGTLWSDPMLNVYTATLHYRGPDRLDVSRQGGSIFAPSWKLLKPFVEARKNCRETEQMRQQFADAYIEEMRIYAKSGQIAQDEWKHLLAREGVTLCCYCTAGQFCHRHLLAGILAKLGARLRGERLDELLENLKSYQAAYAGVVNQRDRLRVELADLRRQRVASAPLTFTKRDARLLALAMSRETTAAERESALSTLSSSASDALKDLAIKAGR